MPEQQTQNGHTQGDIYFLFTHDGDFGQERDYMLGKKEQAYIVTKSEMPFLSLLLTIPGILKLTLVYISV